MQNTNQNEKLIKFEIVTPEKVIFSDEIKQVTIPTTEGEITVLPDHIPLVSLLSPGILEVINSKEEIEIMALSGGFIEVMKKRIVILADTAERAFDIDEDRVEKAKRKAEKEKENYKRFDKERFTEVNADISRALAREKAVKKWRKLKSAEQ